MIYTSATIGIKDPAKPRKRTVFYNLLKIN